MAHGSGVTAFQETVARKIIRKRVILLWPVGCIQKQGETLQLDAAVYLLQCVASTHELGVVR